MNSDSDSLYVASEADSENLNAAIGLQFEDIVDEGGFGGGQDLFENQLELLDEEYPLQNPLQDQEHPQEEPAGMDDIVSDSDSEILYSSDDDEQQGILPPIPDDITIYESNMATLINRLNANEAFFTFTTSL
jgi:hypothetical protein